MGAKLGRLQNNKYSDYPSSIWAVCDESSVSANSTNGEMTLYETNYKSTAWTIYCSPDECAG